MNDHTLQKLYPHTPSESTRNTNASDLYLKEDIPTTNVESTPFVYANFVSSVDGRIALLDQQQKTTCQSFSTPAHMTTELDWMLFEQLQSYASALLTHSGYLRALEQGNLGNALHIKQGAGNDNLQTQRAQLGLPEQPSLIILSRSLNFRLPDSLDTVAQPTIVITNAEADTTRISQLRDNNISVEMTDHNGWITAMEVMSVLEARRLPNLYLQTGPVLLQSMVAQGFLKRLYLTTDLSLTSGDPFVSMLNGVGLDPPAFLKLRSMYLSTQQKQHGIARQQLFNSYELN